MPSTPQVKFNLINNNVEESTPLQGVSIVLARTTKGAILDPSTLIKSVTQFEREFGEEIVPDGSVSNIEKALKGGSILRVIRVVGSGAVKGTINGGSSVFSIKVGDTTKSFKLNCKYDGDPIGTMSTFSFQLKTQQNTLYYRILDGNGSTLETGPIFTFKTKDDNNNTSIDYLALATWVSNNTYFNVSLDSGAMEAFLTELAKADNTTTAVAVTIGDGKGTADADGWYTFAGTIGSSETTAPTASEYIDALEYVKDYTDAYNIIISHLEQLLGQSGAIQVYKSLKTMLDELDEWRAFIEIPWFDTDKTTIRTVDKIVAAAQTIQSAIGYSKWVSYFAGGLKYSNSFGILQSSDVIGTVLGLADASATNYGYNYSFAGVNRGIISDAQGPVCPNYGSPARVEELEKLAQNYVNIIVIKDTPSYGKRTLLWHNFTSQVKQDSFRFLGVTGLVLNIKKTLRPILESFIEEPNYWGTWSRIYLRVKPIIDNWVDNEAMTDPLWNGDQDASSWNDLTVNTEAAARQGHYKAIFSFKDIVALQDITLDVVIEKASKSVSIDIVDSTSNS